MRNFFCKIKVMQAKELFNTRHIHIFPILLLRKIIAVTDASFSLPLSTLVSAQVQSFNLMALLFLLLRITQPQSTHKLMVPIRYCLHLKSNAYRCG